MNSSDQDTQNLSAPVWEDLVFLQWPQVSVPIKGRRGSFVFWNWCLQLDFSKHTRISKQAHLVIWATQWETLENCPAAQLFSTNLWFFQLRSSWSSESDPCLNEWSLQEFLQILYILLSRYLILLPPAAGLSHMFPLRSGPKSNWEAEIRISTHRELLWATATLPVSALTPNQARFLSFLFPFILGRIIVWRLGSSSSITRLLRICMVRRCKCQVHTLFFTWRLSTAAQSDECRQWLCSPCQLPGLIHRGFAFSLPRFELQLLPYLSHYNAPNK